MRDIRYQHVMVVALLIAMATGCNSVHNVDRAQSKELSHEGTVVFVRPTEYKLLGTKSLSDYIEVVYDQGQRNPAGLLEVRVGLRDRGGQHLWDREGRDFPVSVKVTFYEEPVAGQDHRSPPVYETNWQRVMLVRGETTDYKVTCPLPKGAYYQVTLSELK